MQNPSGTKSGDFKPNGPGQVYSSMAETGAAIHLSVQRAVDLPSHRAVTLSRSKAHREREMYWFINALMSYLVRKATQLIKGRGSDQWPRENGTVFSSKAVDLFPGGVAEIIYSYSHKGRYFSGTHERQFGSYFDAERYAKGFLKVACIVVRVKPEHPKTSIVRDEDQDLKAMNLRTRFDY